MDDLNHTGGRLFCLAFILEQNRKGLQKKCGLGEGKKYRGKRVRPMKPSVRNFLGLVREGLRVCGVKEGWRSLKGERKKEMEWVINKKDPFLSRIQT